MKSEKKFLALVVSILLIVGLITRFVSLVRVDGSSMTPSLKANSFHIAIANFVYKSRPERGSVVCARFEGQKTTVIKRVAGIPGDQVRVKDGVLLVAGQEYRYSGDYAGQLSSVFEGELGDGQYFLLGDNFDQSKDSRFLGL